MFKIIKDGALIGMTEAPKYIKKAANGCFNLCPELEAQGISFAGNPYHLLDAPMVKTYINGYCNSEYVMDAVVEKMMGRSEFKGKSPIDPFCGKIDLKF